MDGKGHWWTAEIIHQTQARLIQLMDINNELSRPLILIAAPPKGNGFETVIHSATELGVQRIYPLISARTINPPTAQKIQRWQKIAMEATEQSLRQIVPTIGPSIQFNALWEPSQLWNQADTLTFFCSTEPTRPHLQSTLVSLLDPSSLNPITILTGPEGGWSPKEENQLNQQGWIGISLGKRILRAVTAPILALSLVAAFCECDSQNAQT